MFNALKAFPEPEVEDFCCCWNLNSISPRLLYCDGVWFTVMVCGLLLDRLGLG